MECQFPKINATDNDFILSLFKIFLYNNYLISFWKDDNKIIFYFNII